ncbi:MAG: hypothetical protein ACJ79K_17745 [Gemmatimonadaceae bacterium]
MRIRLTLLAALSAVALSRAPAQSTDFWSGGPNCDALFPSYWQGPGGNCPVDGKKWLLNSQP